MMQRMRRMVLSNWQAKLLSLVLAALLWLGVTSAEQRLGVFPGDIPVSVTAVPEGLSAVIDQQTVKLTLLADQSTWQRLTAKDFRAEIVAQGAVTGVSELAVVVTSQVPGVEITRVEPSRILVRLEEIVTKSVPINVQVDGQAAAGFASGIPITDPPTVSVRGPASRIAQIDEVVTRITLNNEQRTVIQDTTVAALIAGEVPTGVTVTPGKVSVTVPVSRAGNTKTVGVVVVTSGTLPAGVVATAIQPTPSVVSLIGSPTILAQISHVNTQPVSLDDIQNSTEIDSSLVLPEGVQLIESSTDVRIRITVEKGEPDTKDTLDTVEN